MFHLETRIDLLRVPQAMDKQSRARESHQRQPYLHHDQDSPKAVPARAASRRVCAVLQRGHAIHSRSLQRGNQAEEEQRAPRDFGPRHAEDDCEEENGSTVADRPAALHGA